MGSCQSAAKDPGSPVDGSSRHSTKALVKPSDGTIDDNVKSDDTHEEDHTSRKEESDRGSPTTPMTTDMTVVGIDGQGRAKEVKPGIDVVMLPDMPSVEKILNDRQIGLTKIKPGYSSGGSSDDLVETTDPVERPRISSQESNLSQWKSELADSSEPKRCMVRVETEFGRAIEDVYSGVHDGEVLGTGVSGTVRRITHRTTGVNYAVKCLDLGLINCEEKLNQLRDEIFIMCQLDHPNIVRLEEVYEGSTELYLVQELCLGGDLFDRLDEQSDYRYTEAKCARLVKQMLSALRYLHSKNIVHRDLKLENFLFSSTSKDSELKMIDFGLSKFFKKSEVQCECVGTPYTVAPEVIRGSYNERCDLWSLGVITYLLLSGDTPFGGIDGENLVTVKSRILEGSIEFKPESAWSSVSPRAKQFVSSLLVTDPEKRPTARVAQQSKWIIEYTKKTSLEDEPLNKNIAEALVHFKEYSEMRKLLCQVLSFTLLPEQIKNLRAEFEKIDVEGTGEISLAGLKHVFRLSAVNGKLGALTEQEVQEVFNALRVRKTEPTICWHAFIAASLSQCSYDERNLKLAFDRLDYNRKGYVSCEDMNDLLGSYKGQEEMQQVWKVMADSSGHSGRISYDDFRKIMKGQPIEREKPEEASTAAPSSLAATKSPLIKRPSSQRVCSVEQSPILESIQEGKATPQARIRSILGPDKLEQTAINGILLPNLKPFPDLRDAGKDQELELSIVPRPLVHRTRSRSLGSEDDHLPSKEELYHRRNFGRSRRQLSYGAILPSEAIEEIQQVYDSPLAVNRAMCRKQKELRQAILQASKEFDRKRLGLLARPSLGGKRASLTMRRGSVNKAEIADIQQIMDEEAPIPSKKPRRQRRPRMKTASDLTGML